MNTKATVGVDERPTLKHWLETVPNAPQRYTVPLHKIQTTEANTFGYLLKKCIIYFVMHYFIKVIISQVIIGHLSSEK